jgi:hypothetical protein
MIENVEYKGKWRLPESETWINGVVKFTPEDGISLEIFGSFGTNLLNHPSQEIILGETIDGEITLVSNYFRSSINNFDQISIDVYTPTFIIKNRLFNSIDEVRFREISFRLFNLFEWYGSTGLIMNFTNLSLFSINYKRPEDIEFSIHKDCVGKLRFFSPIKTEKSNNRLYLYEECEVSFKYSEKVEFRKLLNDMSIFQRFITLSTFEQSYPLQITLHDDDYFLQEENHKQKLFLHCIYQNIFFNKKYQFRTSNDSLLKFQDIQEEYPRLIRNWYNLFQEIEPTINLLLSYFVNKNKINREKFMEIIRGLETFHRSTSQNTRTPKSEFKKKVTSILGSLDLPKEDNDWLKEELQYSNELKLRDRLIDLIDKYSNNYIKKHFDDIDSICRNVVNTRNYYTHFGNHLKGRIYSNNELVGITQKLTGLLISCVLSEIGVDNRFFEDKLDELL